MAHETRAAQLPLNLRWSPQQRFERYLAGDNADALVLLQHAAAGTLRDWIFLNGPAGAGKTHLLIAACAAAESAGRSVQYANLAGSVAADSSAIRALGGSDLLCIDGIQAIAVHAPAQHALFDLYNRCRAEGQQLVFAASAAPAQLGIGLPDLVSRLSICTQLTLRVLPDAGRREVLRERAAVRGLTLDPAVLDYLFARHARDLNSLTGLLDRLDRESLAAQRRITLPFLRQLLEPGAGAE